MLVTVRLQRGDDSVRVLLRIDRLLRNFGEIRRSGEVRLQKPSMNRGCDQVVLRGRVVLRRLVLKQIFVKRSPAERTPDILRFQIGKIEEKFRYIPLYRQSFPIGGSVFPIPETEIGWEWEESFFSQTMGGVRVHHSATGQGHLRVHRGERILQRKRHEFFSVRRLLLTLVHRLDR